MPLDLTLTPNRSLSRTPTRWLIGGVGLFFFLSGLRFLALGAWPILPFMLADVALLWWAFRTNNAAGRGHERVILADDALTIVRVSPLGAVQRLGSIPISPASRSTRHRWATLNCSWRRAAAGCGSAASCRRPSAAKSAR